MNMEDQLEIMALMRQWDFLCLSDYEAFFDELENLFTIERIQK